MGWPVLAEHCAVQLAKEEALPGLVTVVSRKAPVRAKVPNSVPCVSGRKRVFQGSRWCNANLCFELIPKGVVGSSYSEVGGFT